ncbi:MAG: HAD-IB family phosphatase [Proteobacteria bacterium]|nr:HAD-IB family phosphatase [Pseudomonadota bacterium]
MPIKIVFFDCDGTLTKVKSSWEYIHRKLNIWESNADEYQKLFKEGVINYGEFCRRDALLWKGLTLREVLGIAGQIPYQEGAKEAVAALKEMGIFTVIISTGLSFVIDKVRSELGIHMSLSNELLTESGILTGETMINVEYDGKGCWVEKILKDMGIDSSAACAIGDGEGDKGMFEAVSLSIGFHPCSNMKPFLTHSIQNSSLAGMVDIIKDYA